MTTTTRLVLNVSTVHFRIRGPSWDSKGHRGRHVKLSSDKLQGQQNKSMIFTLIY